MGGDAAAGEPLGPASTVLCNWGTVGGNSAVDCGGRGWSRREGRNKIPLSSHPHLQFRFTLPPHSSSSSLPFTPPAPTRMHFPPSPLSSTIALPPPPPPPAPSKSSPTHHQPTRGIQPISARHYPAGTPIQPLHSPAHSTQRAVWG